MDTKSKSVLLITFGLLGAFILGAMTATAGIAMTRIAVGVMSGGPTFAHGGYHMETEGYGPRADCEIGSEWFDGHHPGMRGSDTLEWNEGERRGPRGMMPGARGDFEESLQDDVLSGETCPMWGTF